MRRLLATTALIGGLALAGPAANAATMLSIGLSTNGGATITTEATSTTGSVGFSGPFGSWTVNQISASDQSVLPAPGILDSSSLDVKSPLSLAGTLTVYISSQGLVNAQQLQEFESSFTSNLISGSITSVSEQTFVDDANGRYALTTALGSHSFSAIGTNDQLETANLTAPFSATEVYTIVSSATLTGGTANSTIDLSTVAAPEPASLALMGVGVLGLGFVSSRKRHS